MIGEKRPYAQCEICGEISPGGVMHKTLPHKVDALEKRVAELEKLLSDLCGALGQPAAEHLRSIEERLDNLDHADRISDV